MKHGDGRRPIVIGVGNTMRRDDGAGPSAGRMLAPLIGDENVAIIATADPVRLMDAWRHRPGAILVDACAGDGPPGALHKLVMNGPSEFLRLSDMHGGRSSVHVLGLASALRLADALGALPDELVLYTLAGQDFSFGEGLSPELASAMETLTQKIVEDYF